MAILFSVAVTILIVGWLWFYIARPILIDYGVIRVDDEGEIVSRSQAVMASRESPATPDEQTDRQTDEVSATDRWTRRLEVDRSKTALIELMVYTGWTVGEIRAVIKGDNGAIGLEIEAARRRLGMAPTEGYRTPVANRSTDAKFQDALN